ncbi:hypothetical protein EYF80_038867 [Liparis tanakae]|uniref:Trimeric autotransporter adhesin YadA-like head domain-containing protein n=1 Tax=Liparis tanakae TaxID=230148 RepID=A0A4Z2GDY6_9TELE|nr:hypothetical protein EYF80_038867 [Liparis tanakae]
MASVKHFTAISYCPEAARRFPIPGRKSEVISPVSSSTTLGFSSTALGFSSTALGFSSTALGFSSTALGFSSTALGFSSTALGFSSTALGFSSTTLGFSSLGGEASSCSPPPGGSNHVVCSLWFRRRDWMSDLSIIVM